MVQVKEKTVVRMLLSATTAGHARTDVTVRDVGVCIDEPAERGGTNAGATPTETLAASLLGCTSVICHRIAAKLGMEIHDLRMQLEVEFDRRGAGLVEEVEVPFPRMHLTVALKTDAHPDLVERMKGDLQRYCPVSKVLRAAGTRVEQTWQVHAP